jgi:hypothetical protein
MGPLGKQPKRIDVFSVPEHHRDGERVFLVPQLREAVIRERLHELESAKKSGVTPLSGTADLDFI